MRTIWEATDENRQTRDNCFNLLFRTHFYQKTLFFCMKIYFILVTPAHAGNVGASARALKTMGFDSLHLVGADIHGEAEAVWRAHGAGELLTQAMTFQTISDATADCDLVVGTTARRRGTGRAYHDPAQLREALASKGDCIERVAVLFGCEAHGLSNRELSFCDLLSTVPLAANYPSLNLSQAVMIYAYELSVFNNTQDPCQTAADPGQLRMLKEKTATLLKMLELGNHRKLIEWANDRLGLLAQRDIKLLHTLIGELQKRLV
jgi:tRNA/rRNA methyltransferase